MIITNPLDLDWQKGPLPDAAAYELDAMVVLAWIVWPDRTWTIGQVYLRQSHTGASYWAMKDGAPLVPSFVQHFAVIRDQPHQSFTPDDLDRIHTEVTS